MAGLRLVCDECGAEYTGEPGIHPNGFISIWDRQYIRTEAAGYRGWISDEKKNIDYCEKHRGLLLLPDEL